MQFSKTVFFATLTHVLSAPLPLETRQVPDVAIPALVAPFLDSICTAIELLPTPLPCSSESLNSLTSPAACLAYILPLCAALASTTLPLGCTVLPVLLDAVSRSTVPGLPTIPGSGSGSNAGLTSLPDLSNPTTVLDPIAELDSTFASGTSDSGLTLTFQPEGSLFPGSTNSVTKSKRQLDGLAGLASSIFQVAGAIPGFNEVYALAQPVVLAVLSAAATPPIPSLLEPLGSIVLGLTGGSGSGTGLDGLLSGGSGGSGGSKVKKDVISDA